MDCLAKDKIDISDVLKWPAGLVPNEILSVGGSFLSQLCGNEKYIVCYMGRYWSEAVQCSDITIIYYWDAGDSPETRS